MFKWQPKIIDILTKLGIPNPREVFYTTLGNEPYLVNYFGRSLMQSGAGPKLEPPSGSRAGPKLEPPSGSRAGPKLEPSSGSRARPSSGSRAGPSSGPTRVRLLLLEPEIKQKDKIKEYTIPVTYNDKTINIIIKEYQEYDRYVISTQNPDGAYCILIYIEDDVSPFYNIPTKIAHLQTIGNDEKCIIHREGFIYPSGGKILLKAALKHLKDSKDRLKITKIKLLDNAYKMCKNGKTIQLSVMHVLLDGHTWYDNKIKINFIILIYCFFTSKKQYNMGDMVSDQEKSRTLSNIIIIYNRCKLFE